jgi:hypothetical protein
MNAVGRVERPDNPDNVCTAGVYALFTVMEGTKTYAQALMDELGSDAHPDRMALVPGKQNRRKNLVRPSSSGPVYPLSDGSQLTNFV